MSVLAQFKTPYPHRMGADLPDAATGSAAVEVSDLIFGWPGTGEPILDIQSLKIEKMGFEFLSHAGDRLEDAKRKVSADDGCHLHCPLEILFQPIKSGRDDPLYGVGDLNVRGLPA